MNIIRERFYYKCDDLFLGVDSKKLKLLESKNLSIKKHKILFKEGSYPDGVYRLSKGKMKVYQLTPAGKFQIVYIYTKGDFFGFRPLLSNTKNPVSVEALEDSQLIFYPKEHFLKFLTESPTLMQNLLVCLSYEFNVWVNRMAAFSHKSVKERVALALLILNEKFKKLETEKIATIDIGREDLANFSGTTTETCVRILTQLKEEKLIKTVGRKIKINNEKEIFSLADIN